MDILFLNSGPKKFVLSFLLKILCLKSVCLNDALKYSGFSHVLARAGCLGQTFMMWYHIFIVVWS